MERSSYLEFFDNTKRNLPYVGQKDANEEEENLLLVLVQLLEQQRAGVLSMEFAVMDWLAA